MGEADEHQVQCPSQAHDPQDWIQHAAENCELYSEEGGMQKHPLEDCHLVCQSKVFPSSQMYEQQAEICQTEEAQKRKGCQEDSSMSQLI